MAKGIFMDKEEVLKGNRGARTRADIKRRGRPG
jgi:hypothetical protein